VLGQHRSTQRRVPTGPDDEERLTADIVELARRHGRLGYRKTAEMLRSTAGWIVNDKRVERIWRGAEGRIWLASRLIGGSGYPTSASQGALYPARLRRIAAQTQRNASPDV
jgi:hypothetical protein